MFDIEDIDSYADDSYIIKSAKSLEELKQKLQDSARNLIDWFTKSGLIVNKTKTEILLMMNKESESIMIDLDGEKVKSKSNMKVLGIWFDSKLSWDKQVEEVILKMKKAGSGLRILAKYIPQDKMLQLATAFAYSRFFYGAPIWLNA